MSHDSYERLSSADYYPNSKCAGMMGGGTLDEMMSRYHKCMCEHGVDMYCPFDEYERRAPTRLYGHAGFPRWRPTTTSTTTTPRPHHDNAGFPRRRPTTTTSTRRNWYDEDSYSNNRGGWDEDSHFSNKGGWSTDNGQRNMSFQPVFVGWNIFGWIFVGGLIAAAAVLLSWKCSRRRQQAGESGCQRPDSGTERARQHPEPGAHETAPLRPSAPPAASPAPPTTPAASPAPSAPPTASPAPSAPPAANPADDLPPPYELVAHLAPPPYQAAIGPDGATPGFDGEAKCDATKGDDATKGEAATTDGDAVARSDHAFGAADVCVMMDEEHGDT